jgi:uncharacterized protein (DUF1684 family)
MTTDDRHDHDSHDDHADHADHADHGEHGDHEHHEHEHQHHEHSYQAAIDGYRSEKDAFFKSSRQSPIPADQREAFEGLPYYPVDPDLVFENLVLQPYVGDEPTSFQIPTSDGQLRPARRAGTFTFDLDGAPRRLTAYTFESSPSDSLFVPFLDQTSGHETYGAGRYLDLEPDDDGTYAIDFNLAYHPSCVYAPQYSCPLTPAENRLDTRIEAGERLGEGDAEH